MTIYSSVTHLVGNTPLVRINSLSRNAHAHVIAKAEFFNPASSVKDRIAVAIVDAAEQSGQLKPGGTIVEATSGNTGVGLAMVGAARGYRVVITMPESMSQERRMLMRAFGAELVLTPASQGMKGTVEAARSLVENDPNAVWARQFENTANPAIHRLSTAQEIWDDTNGAIDVFIAGIGTGGTISGVGAFLKEKNPDIRVIGIEPEESPLMTQGKAGPHAIQGIGANFVPSNYDPTVVDEVITIKGSDALEYARRAAREEGLFVGISSGANLAGALSIARRQEMEDKTIVTVLPDTGERYLSTPLYSTQD
ncbi:MAG: cysteine synthase A [Actinomycetaceae bacterium]|nr:cysteine synthase A [Actinomycetaceae bacterium]